MALLERLVDRRAFVGAVTLLVVGVQLTVLLVLYFFGSSPVRAVFQSRWFWELALNFQILLLFLMWVCHVDRISSASGWRKTRAIGRLVAGLMGVSLPFLTLVVCTRNNWFYEKPPFAEVRAFAYWLIGAWVMLAYGLPLLAGLLLRHRRFLYLSPGGGGLRQNLFHWVPFLVFVLAVLVSALMDGGEVIWVLMPMAIYIHGAVPYLYRAFYAPPEGDMLTNGIDIF